MDNLLKTVDKHPFLGKSRPFVRIIPAPLPPYTGVSSHPFPYREFLYLKSPGDPFYPALSTGGQWKDNPSSFSYSNPAFPLQAQRGETFFMGIYTYPLIPSLYYYYG